jgi:hypothetical protein
MLNARVFCVSNTANVLTNARRSKEFREEKGAASLKRQGDVEREEQMGWREEGSFDFGFDRDDKGTARRK